MKLINSLPLALGLVALASRIVTASATANPLVVAGRRTAKNVKAFIGSTANRRLLELQGGECQPEVTALTSCVFVNCAEGEECPDHVRYYPADFLTSTIESCDILQKNYCTELSILDVCCPACTELTVKYWECSLKNQYLASCSDMIFECDGMTNGDTTSAIGGETDEGLSELGAECNDEANEYFYCSLSFCLDTDCDSGSASDATGDNDTGMESCETLKDTVCEEFETQKSCCPECIESYKNLLNCAATEVVAEVIGFPCPNVECDGKLVLLSDEDTTGESDNNVTGSEATCESSVAAYSWCMHGNCSSATCDAMDSAINESRAAPSEENCEALEIGLCSQFSGHEKCCPQCIEAFLLMTNLCAPKEIGEQCSDIVCDGTLVLSGSVSFGGSMIFSVTTLGIFALGLVVF